MTSTPHDCHHRVPVDLLPWADPYIARLFADHHPRQCPTAHSSGRCRAMNHAEGERTGLWGETLSALVTDREEHVENERYAERRWGRCGLAAVRRTTPGSSHAPVGGQA